MIFSEGLVAGVQLTNGIFQLVIDAGEQYRGNLEGDCFIKNNFFSIIRFIQYLEIIEILI